MSRGTLSGSLADQQSGQSMRSKLDTPQAIASMVVLVVVGAMFFLLMPMYIGALADYAHFGNEQIGNLTFFELIGVASASLTSLFWIRKADWRYQEKAI